MGHGGGVGKVKHTSVIFIPYYFRFPIRDSTPNLFHNPTRHPIAYLISLPQKTCVAWRSERDKNSGASNLARALEVNTVLTTLDLRGTYVQSANA